MSIMYLGLVLILPTKLHLDLATLSDFQDFRFLPPAPLSVNGSDRDLKDSFEARDPSKYQISLRYDHPFVS